MQKRKQDCKDCSKVAQLILWLAMLLVPKILEYDFEYERHFQNVRKTYSEISNIWLYWKIWIQNEKGKKGIIVKIDYFVLFYKL